MDHPLYLYNSLTRKLDRFVPINEPFVGLYVCGPTVYGDPHLGHARPAIIFDVLFRYLKELGYKVRYVRNITDVGHLENDADDGEDKIQKKARLEQLEPMEIVNYYTRRYHQALDLLNIMPPSIEPFASGHIPEQIELIQEILDNGYAYLSNGSVYFDVIKYQNDTNLYGILSGRKLEDLLAHTRELQGKEEKKSPYDFALWKKATPQHIMQWNSPWSKGFPGWHLECSVMGAKYLGIPFDIHGGGIDLQFPHHECEIAQAVAAKGVQPVKYWVHNNLITINGQKMSKSLNNFITLEELFAGNHPALENAFSPMVIRFFILQAHYRSPLDFSNEALKAAEGGLNRLTKAFMKIEKLSPNTDKTDLPLLNLKNNILSALNDDLNTPIAIANLFEAVKHINLASEQKINLSSDDIEILYWMKNTIIENILGIKLESSQNVKDIAPFIDLILDIRWQLKQQKNYALADDIRNRLIELGIKIYDLKDKYTWEIED
ncbi:MAG: cysteine--tRNA ligase [Bacteroidales bacterium]|jgi:cysteinyl-tRNA synthetase|nr:cysteine--tRNA ligase [Bacteroidales bacterium]MDI9575086.1 cysteine--tRNA ligase [Bacteroidota bacterium]MDD3755257.1 cysteine--tRNA ligase [Bacteroidales bacterium]MDY0400482.1 cysteine--tRNA ligase [Bacteroidales bacterium]HHW59805.1 cysteine--tRNA ligase [Bacteroidales bacterium]